MSEITKLYENAGVSKEPAIIPSSGEVIYWKNYPPFTAKKQLELIKWLALRDYTTIGAYVGGWFYSEHSNHSSNENSLEGCLASLINSLWQDLTEEEKQQVKGILE